MTLFRGDTLSTSWTPIDRASPSSKYPPSVSPSSKYPQGHSPSSKYPPGVSQTSQASSSGSTLAHGIEARQGSLRSGESGKYIPHLADWAGVVDISAHATGSRLSLAVHQDPHFRARHQLQTPSYRGSIAEPFYRGSLAEPRALAVNIEPVEASATLAYHQKHLPGTSSSSYGSSPDGVVMRTTGHELPLYGDPLDLDLPLRTSLHLRGRADFRPGRVDAIDHDRRSRELGERWAALQQHEQRQRGEVEQIRAAFKPRSQVLPTVHEFTHDTLVTRIPLVPLLREDTLLRPAKEVARLYEHQGARQQIRAEAESRRKLKTKSVCRVCKVSCMFIILTNLIFVIIVGIIIFNGGLDFFTLPSDSQSESGK